MALSRGARMRLKRAQNSNEMETELSTCGDIIHHQAWEPFEVDMSVFADKEMSGFVGMQILTNYDPELLKKSTSGTKDRKEGKASNLADEGRKKNELSKPSQKGATSAVNHKDGKQPVGKERRKNDIGQSKIPPHTNRDGGTTKKAAKIISKGSEMREKGWAKRTKDDGADVPPRVEIPARKRKSGKDRIQEWRMKRKRGRYEQESKHTIETREDEQTKDAKQTCKGFSKEWGEVDMCEWGGLTIPSVVHKSLLTMGFTEPTPIQKGCVPVAISQGKDIVGAAETGSGKTLAFGIPLIYRILQHRASLSSSDPTTTTTTSPDAERRGEDSIEGIGESEGSHRDEENWKDTATFSGQPGGDAAVIEGQKEEIDAGDAGQRDSSLGCVTVIDNIDEMAWQSAGLPLTKTFYKVHDGQGKKLFGLVLTPTRELAVQVKNHLVAAAQMTDIQVAVVVGGMSAEKQKRILKKRPDVIVGTPGRIWELYSTGEPHLSSLPYVQCLIIDEADRMVEKGHYAELSELLDLLNSSALQQSRQIFVFSATLSLTHLGPRRKSLKTEFKMDKKDKLDSVMSKVGIKEDAHVVDLTKREGTASTLLESKIVCKVDEKDVYLFYFLLQYPGRTLVFTNSIDCIRRLASILALLQCSPLPLHSSMHQKQRLKNLERFTSNPRGLLLATDVAARGLDIPDIEHVIHYQVPRTSESYVHRSGRTARQAKVGLSVTFVSSGESSFYRRLCKTLNREELPTFPVEHSYYRAVKERVDLARDIDKMEHLHSKKKHHNDWFIRAARELDVDVDEDMNLHDLGDSLEQKQFNKKLKMLKAHLNSLLKKKIFATGSSQLYPTANGTLLSPFVQAPLGAHEAATKLKARMKIDREDNSQKREKRRKKFKRMGRYQKGGH